MGVSAVVIAKNEAAAIEACLRTLTWADEIVVVVDASTTDATREIARRYTNRVVDVPFRGFASQRKEALRLAAHDWVLFVDADERVTADLRDEIQAVLAGAGAECVPPADGVALYKIPRMNYMLGRRVRYGDWGWDCLDRLMRRDRVRYRGREVHEELDTESLRTGRLQHHLIHHSHPDLTSVVAKLNQYSTIEAQHLFRQGHPPVGALRMLWEAARHFCFRHIRAHGWRDGLVGLIVNGYQAFSVVLTYAKLWELQNTGGASRQATDSD